jgi:hypothetical protein
MPSEIQMVAKDAEKACAAAVNYPANIEVRRRLFDVLGEMVELAHLDNATYSDRLHDLHRQIGIWIDIVRHRIDNATSSTLSLRYAARDLQRLLSQLIDELQEPARA